jgi:phospholipid/cholesterol/gamma-HCH transport system substrate-binding protein
MAEGSYLSSAFPASSRRFAGFALIVVIASAIAIGLFLRHPAHTLAVRACFHDARGLRAGAAVRIAGVDVGTVRTIRAQPTNSSCPASVEMEIATDYSISLPSDAVASINTAGILGAPYVTIDAMQAFSSPLANGGQIRSREGTPGTPNLEQVVEKFMDNLKDKAQEQKNEAPCAQTPSAKTSASRPHPVSRP